MGLGIWSMHYIGMLAFHLPVPVFYDWPTVLSVSFSKRYAARTSKSTAKSPPVLAWRGQNLSCSECQG